MLLINPDECDYGEKTDAVRAILRSCDMNWNALLQSSRDEPRFHDALDRHFRCLEKHSGFHSLHSPAIKVVRANWRSAEKLRQSLVMSDTVPLWRKSLSTLVENAESALMSVPQLYSLIKPPIWHYSGVLHIVNPLLADRSLLPGDLDLYKWELAWDFMCDVEQFAHNALLFELASKRGECNPFEELISVYRKGAFPIDYDNGEFFVFVA